MKFCFGVFFALCLTGCAPSLQVNTDYQSQAQSSRVQYIVLHYTSAGLERSLELLTGPDVGAHYLIGDQAQPVVYQLVDENRRAWHAGESAWQGRTWLNASTLGIEIVNLGYDEDEQGQRSWQPYPPEQIEQLVVLLQELVKRHDLPIDSIVAHSDIAPQRKVDPGPLFPWQRLAEAGLIRWPDAQQVTQQRARFAQNLPSAQWFQEQLRQLGYPLEVTAHWDQASRNVLAAFQMKYRPSNYAGQPDAESAALLAVLNQP